MKKIRLVFALVAMLGMGIGSAACTSPIAPDSNANDFGSNNYEYGAANDFGSNN